MFTNYVFYRVKSRSDTEIQNGIGRKLKKIQQKSFCWNTMKINTIFASVNFG